MKRTTFSIVSLLRITPASRRLSSAVLKSFHLERDSIIYSNVKESCAGPGNINPTASPPRMTTLRRGTYRTTTSLMKMPNPTTRVAAPTFQMKMRSARRRMRSLRFFNA
ncbi:hypothetical protein BDZ89DRAFT_480010 [Hymenopellis radicata]|nr:hypothetical protein BDZ89DRAFT_480010 [Hymenopellis radicata]